MWSRLALVALGGALGAVARYVTSQWVTQLAGNSAFPWGTFTVNVVGSSLLGFLMALGFGEQGHLPAHFRLLAASGFLGAFTTFSTFSFETLEALEGGQLKLAAIYVTLSLCSGLLACALGWQLGNRI